nr:MAG TPA: hypothetical protein [Bacteriophage sp.]
MISFRGIFFIYAIITLSGNKLNAWYQVERRLL